MFLYLASMLVLELMLLVTECPKCVSDNMTRGLVINAIILKISFYISLSKSISVSLSPASLVSIVISLPCPHQWQGRNHSHQFIPHKSCSIPSCYHAVFAVCGACQWPQSSLSSRCLWQSLMENDVYTNKKMFLISLQRRARKVMLFTRSINMKCRIQWIYHFI